MSSNGGGENTLHRSHRNRVENTPGDRSGAVCTGGFQNLLACFRSEREYATIIVQLTSSGYTAKAKGRAD
jgi:hypothetical protein